MPEMKLWVCPECGFRETTYYDNPVCDCGVAMTAHSDLVAADPDAAVRAALIYLMPRAVFPILSALSAGPMDATDIALKSALSRSIVQYALRKLPLSGLVTPPHYHAHLDGRKRLYYITDLGRAVLSILGGDPDAV